MRSSWLDFGTASTAASKMYGISPDLAMILIAKSGDPGHGLRVSAISYLLACETENPEQIAAAALMHDIGKAAIPDSILKKCHSLSGVEMELVRAHAEIGASMVSHLPGDGSAFIPFAAQAILHHHEKWDGTGYPQGLSGGKIPLASRIIALADATDALASNRIYQAALPIEEVFATVEAGFATAFDSELIRSFAKSKDGIADIYG